MRVRSDKEDLTLRDRLKIDPNSLEGCRVFILRDCLDQTQLNIEFSREIQREWVDELAEESDVTWIDNSMFIIDKPRYYRLVGVVGRRNLNVRFRLSGLNMSAWNHLLKILSNIIQR